MIDQDGAGGSSGGEEYAVDPESLQEMAKGLTGVLGELKKLGTVENADLGDNFDAIGLTGMQLGSSWASSVLGSFGYHWKWEVRSLFTEGSDLAEELGLSAGGAYDNDQYIKGTFKDVVLDGVGNPQQSDADAAKRSLSSSMSQDLAPDESDKARNQHITAALKAEAADEAAVNHRPAPPTATTRTAGDAVFGSTGTAGSWSGLSLHGRRSARRPRNPPASPVCLRYVPAAFTRMRSRTSGTRGARPPRHQEWCADLPA